MGIKKLAIGWLAVVMMLWMNHIALCATRQQPPPQEQDAPYDDGYDEEDEADVPPPPPPPRATVQQPRQQYEQDSRYEGENEMDDKAADAPPGTLFNRIAKGMSYRHVVDLIGPPSDTKEYLTGKNFIPFYMGTDNVRLEAIYKNQGRITFTGRPLRVYHIVVNPRESGYNE